MKNQATLCYQYCSFR